MKSLLILKSDTFILNASVIGTSVSHSKTADWQSQPILNRASGVLNYNNSSNETLEFTIKLVAFTNALKEVVTPIKSLQSLVYPLKAGTIPPSICYLTYGGIFTSWMCVVTNVGVNYPDGIWSPEGYPMTAEVRMSLLEVDIENRSAISGTDIYTPFDSGVLH